MKAVTFKKYGSPDLLEIEDIPKPAPKNNEVLIQVNAVSINDWDWLALHGTPFVNKLIFGFPNPRIQILGSDIAGEVVETGDSVTKFKTGDFVFGDLSNQWGGFAEYVCAKESAITPMSNAMSFDEAAAIPQAGTLAAQCLLDNWTLKSGQKILINGAGGGVGTTGLQIAKQFDIEVTGVDNKYKLDMMKTIGFDHVIDYEKVDFTESEKQYDLIIDTKTNRSISKYLKVLKPKGTYITVGAPVLWCIKAILLSPFISLFFKRNVKVISLAFNKHNSYLCKLFDSGMLKPVIDKRFTLNELPQALSYFGEAKHKGKVIVNVR